MIIDKTAPLVLPVIFIFLGAFGLGVGLCAFQKTHQRAQEAEKVLVEIQRRVDPPKPAERIEGEPEPSLV